MEALRLQDGAFVRARYEELQESRRQRQQLQPDNEKDKSASSCAPSREMSAEQRQELEQWRIVERAAALDAQGPTPQWRQKFSVLASILESLYAEQGTDPSVTSPSKMALSRPETGDGASPVPLKELPVPTQVALKMFFRTCQSLRDPAKLMTNSRLSVQIASKLPLILTTMPPCVLSPGLVDDTSVDVEDGGNVSSVFYQLFRLFEELLGVGGDEESSSVPRERVCLSVSDQAAVIVAYVALALKWGRLAYLLKGVQLLLESGDELNGARFEPLGPLFRELAATSIERPQIAFGEEEQPCGYLMSFGKGDHGKLGHGQCSHVSCQEGNCTENKMVPTMIAATRDVLFCKIDSLSTHSIAITAKGEAMAWGNGDKYRLGHGSSSKEYMPRTIEFLSLKGRVRDLACGLGHTLALMESGELYAWGNGSNGRLGLGDTNDRSSPTRVVLPPPPARQDEEPPESNSASTAPVRFRHIFCGASHSLGLSWNGRAYAWGKNNQGQCGHGHTNDQWTIQEIESFRDAEEGEEEECVVFAAGGWEHTLFCTASGRVYSCGCGYKDSRRAGIPPVLGHGDCDRRLKPTLVQSLDDAHEEVVKVACGWDHSLAVTANGRVYTWGSGTNGKLGHGDEESFDIPTLVRCMDGKKVKDAKAGCEHTVFLTYDHELWTCGQGDSGRLGHGDSQTRKRPTKVELFAGCGLKPVALAVGDKYNLVLVKDADGHDDHDIDNSGISVQNSVHQVNNDAVSSHGTTNTHHGVHRAAQHKKHHDNQQISFGAKWVLEIGAGQDGKGGPATTKAVTPTKDESLPSSARGVALFIAGHIDRLASDYIADDSDVQSEKQNESSANETVAKAQSVLLPFAVDTSRESLSALLQLLRWTASCSEVKEKAARSERSGSDGSCVPPNVRMGLVLSCLRVLQLNLKRSRGVASQNAGSLFNHIHELLDTLAGQKGEDIANRFGNGARRSGGALSLSAAGSAVSQEAASALKMGFGIFFPTGIARSKLLWGILDDCKIEVPSMRTIILTDQLCKDSVMTEIFKSVTSYGLLPLSKTFDELHGENSQGKDVFDIKTLMVMLLQRCSAAAVKHLEDEAFTDFSREPDCFLRLLHVLQMHYFSIVHQVTHNANETNKRGTLDPDPAANSASQRMMDFLLEYVDALMTEALAVLKRLHKASRQHEDIITWRLNGSFFHTLLPSALECMSVLLLPDSKQEKTSENLLLVERALPSLHIMLKMLDEVSWKMHTAGDGGNQTHDARAPTHSHYLSCKSHESNWFVDLGDACAVLCGKLSCQLFYPSHVSAMDNAQHGVLYAAVIKEGSFLEERHDAVVSTDMASSGSIARILEWERLGVFEVEDELIGSADHHSTSETALPPNVHENQRFLLQLCETDFSDKPTPFLGWIASSLSYEIQLTVDISRLFTIAVSVSAWHLGLVDELRQMYELYDKSREIPQQKEASPTSKIWEMFAVAVAMVKNAPSFYRHIDSDAIANAIKFSRLLLSLQPNPAVVGFTLRSEVNPEEDHPEFWDSLEDLIKIMTSVDANVLDRSFRAREVHAALVRTGVCILHDLLRKLTTSSAKSGLLNEFVSVTCASSPMSSKLNIQRIALNGHSGKHAHKAIENLFVRLARIISSDDASFELRKKALLAWTVPLGTSKQSGVALIAKSGIMSTLIDLLLDDANVLETHSEPNAVAQVTNHAGVEAVGDKMSGSAFAAESQPTKVNPVNALLFDRTPAQIISTLAWEAFCAIAWQLTRSERFVQQRSALFLRAAGSSLQDRDLLTPRSTSMSPRRRLTLPKKMVVSTIDEIIEQLIDGLFLMLKRVKARFEAIEFFSNEYEKLLRSSADHDGGIESSVRDKKCSARVFLLARPILLSHTNTQDVRIPKTCQTGNESDGTSDFTLSFWIYVEHTGVTASKHAAVMSSTNSRPNGSCVRLLAFGSDQGTGTGTDPAGSDKLATLVVFTRDAYSDHVSIGVSIWRSENAKDSWSTVLIDEHVQRGNWIHVALGFAKNGQDPFRAFVGGKHSTLNNGKRLVDNSELISAEFLQRAATWSGLTAGGNVNIPSLDQGGNDTNGISLSKKINHYGFSAILDDVIITRGVLAEEMAVRMQISGTVLFRLKQQHVVEKHCEKVLQLLCQLVGGSERNSDQSSAASLPLSDRWIILFSRMLLTTCQDQDLAQVYLCYLLQDILPRAPPLPEFDIQAVAQSLFATPSSRIKRADVEELFAAFNEKSYLPSTTAARQHEVLYRLMQQHGILHGLSREKSSSGSTSDTVPFKTKLSVRFAAAIHLFQKLWSTPSWKSRMDEYSASSSSKFRSFEGPGEILQSLNKDRSNAADVYAVVNVIAGYSEEELNLHRTSTQDGATFPSPLQVCSLPFSSVFCLENSGNDQVTSIQTLMVAMLREGAQPTLSLPARSEILAKYHNDVVSVDAADRRIGSLLHLRTRVLRVLMTVLLRELNEPTATHPWHHFLLESAVACDDLLGVASSSTREYVTTVLGSDAKVAMKLRRLRVFSREVLRGGKRHRSILSAVSITDLESLQWRLWEEMSLPLTSTPLSPWWQQHNDGNGKLTLEVVGGDVELSELKVTALEHFPTVKLSQANICANSGLWFFEVVVLTDGLMQIGYVDGDFTADPLQGQGVGDHTNSWAFDGFRCKKWNVNSYDYGEQWKTDHVVGVLLDTERMEISYFLNGKFLGVAFSGIPITSSSRMCPAASLNVHQSAQFNFGTLSANDGGSLAPTLGGFKHLPTLDTEDQARLRPIVYVIQSRRPFKSGGASNVDSQDKSTSNVEDLGDDWSSSSSSDDDTDDGGIVLEGSEGPSGLRRHLEPGSRDGRETRTADTNDEDAGQRRRDLVEGLTGLGFPLEWATRCATETRLPIDETGAVAWILEQMEKVGLDGASTLPSMVSAATGDGTECPSHPSVLWRTGAQLPNSVVDDSADGMATESGSFPGVGVLIPADKIDGSDASQILRVSDNQLAFISATRPGSSLTERLTAEPAQLNLFSEGDQDDQCSDDESTEAFQSSLYRQHQALHNELHLLGRSDAESTTNETDGKRGVDDLLPLSIAVDTTVFIAYARQAFTSLLLLAQQEAERGVVYAMVRRLVSTDESSLKFYRVLRMVIGLDTVDPTFELGVVSDTIHSEQSLQLQKALAALLEYESQRTSDSTTEQSELNSLFKSLSQEMMSQCDRGLSLVRSKSSSKAAADPVAMQAAAVWFAWVSGIVLSFIETQASATALAFAPAVCNTAFVENLVSIVSSSSSTSKPWKYVAFRLISRILSVTHTSEGVKLQLLSSAQLANVTELFTLRRRREMHDRIFFSDVTSCLFTLLVRSTSPCSFLPSSSNPCLSDKTSVKLVVSNYSSTHVTISWEQVSPTALLAASSDDIADATNTEAEAEAESNPDIMLLEVNRCGSLYAGHSLPTDSETNSTKALPSKGTYTIRNLLPDTTYCIRVGPAQAMDGAVNTATKTGAELIVQTHPAPVFDLDNETMGKNLVAFNRNLTAKNTVNKKWHSVRASVAFDEGVHQWQVRLDTCVSKNIFIGVCTAEASMENYIGSDAYGYGFLANKAVWHNKAKLHSYGEIFKQGDIIQVTLDCNAKTLAFSRNGEYLGIAASNMHAGIGRSGANGGGDSNCKWYPAFSMYNKDDKVTLIPPPAVSGFSSKEGRPQNASTFELIEAMHDVLAYQSHVTSLQSARDLEAAKLFEKAYEAFEDWRRGQKIFREISLGQIIAINNSKAATEKYGLAAGDSVFTSKGQCTVLGEYRHELWYEVDEAGSSSLFGSTTTQLASWSLSVCREMLASPDEYPVHRHHKYKLELGSNTGGETQTVEQQDWATKPSEEEAFSYQEFVEAQERWGDSGVSAAELDAKLIAELDAIATQQASSSSWALSFADVSTALLLERIYEVHGISEERGSSQTIARIGLVLYVNRCLYNVARLALPRNINATSLGTPGSSDTLSSEQNSGKALPTMANTECNLVSPVAPLLNSPHWGLSDASDFHFISTLAARLLFASQKEKLIGEELRATKTTSRSSENLQESRDNEEGGVDNDLPVVKINYSLPPPTPFWECNSSSRRTSLRLPPSSETSIFVQLATQLAARDARQWRRESSQPFEAIPISQTFQVRVDKSSGDPSKETASQQPDEDEDDDQLQQPSSKQTARYLQVFENVVREVQSPSFPLFTPVESSRTDNRALQDELGSTLQLDINMELFSPSALAQSRVRIPQLLLWYFGFGQCLGIAWRSKVLVPLQFLSSAFWIELADPTDRVADVSGVREDRSARAAAIRAIRDGLFSIVPSRCVTLMSSNNPSLRDRLSDADVNYVARLERHATYSGPRQDRHDMFWKVVGAFTSLERRMLEQFINPDRRTEMKQLESKTESPSAFVLEIADALADGRDHPDSCYPVVVQIGPHSSRLHLPAYSSAQTLRHKLLLAMTNIPFM